MKHFILTFVFMLLLKSGTYAQFEDIASSRNLNHLHNSPFLMGGGLAFFDYNNDGLEDIYYTGGADTDKLYKNLGNGLFKDVSSQSGILSITMDFMTAGVVNADINNDNCEDIFVTVFDEFQNNLLFLNNCDGTFTEISNAANIIETAKSVSATFIDINNDGFIDIYVGNYIDESSFIFDNNGEVIGFDHTCFPNFLYKNNGDNTFTEMAFDYGVNDTGCALAVIASDFDQDGDTDIYIANDFGEFITPNILYENKIESQSFVKVPDSLGLNVEIYAMGIAIADFDNDLDLDFYITNLGKNVLLENNNGIFSDKAEVMGAMDEFAAEGSRSTGWGTFFFDYQNDGYLDIFNANGFIGAADFLNTTSFDPNTILKSNSALNFTDESDALNINSTLINRGAAYADFDNDGDLDFSVVTVKSSATADATNIHFYENKIDNNNTWLQVDLEGTITNKTAYGTQVLVYTNEHIYMQELISGGTHASQNSQILHFGLGTSTKIDSIKIKWPLSQLQTFFNIPIKKRIAIIEQSPNYDIMGCMQSYALNYDPDATVSGGCFTAKTFGCTNALASNFDPNALVDNGSCEGIVLSSLASLLDYSSVFPNPFNNYLKFSFSKKKEIKIYRYNGTLVEKFICTAENIITLDTNKYSKGMYFAIIFDVKSNSSITIKLFK